MYTSNKDGSLDGYIQKENPGKDKVSNWLPAHKKNRNKCIKQIRGNKKSYRMSAIWRYLNENKV